MNDVFDIFFYNVTFFIVDKKIDQLISPVIFVVCWCSSINHCVILHILKMALQSKRMLIN